MLLPLTLAKPPFSVLLSLFSPRRPSFPRAVASFFPPAPGPAPVIPGTFFLARLEVFSALSFHCQLFEIEIFTPPSPTIYPIRHQPRNNSDAGHLAPVPVRR